MSTKLEITTRRLRLKLWICVEVLVPLLFIIWLWPIRYLCKQEDCLVKTFENGDLLLVSGVILLGILADIYYDLRRFATVFKEDAKSAIDNYLILGGFLALLVFALAATIKGFELVVHLPSSILHFDLTWRPWATIWGGTAVILWGLVIQLFVLRSVGTALKQIDDQA